MKGRGDHAGPVYGLVRSNQYGAIPDWECARPSTQRGLAVIPPYHWPIPLSESVIWSSVGRCPPNVTLRVSYKGILYLHLDAPPLFFHVRLLSPIQSSTSHQQPTYTTLFPPKPQPSQPTFKMTGGKSGGKASGSKNAQS